MIRIVRRLACVAFVAATVLVATGCATWRKCGFSGCAGDRSITADLESRLRDNRAIEEWGIRVQTLDHVVYLYGLVDTNLERGIVEATALEVPGVRRVVNAISVRNPVW